MTTAKTGCLSSPPVMNPRLGAKERSKSTGWSSSTVICVRGAGQGCFFRYKTGSISVTGSLSAARTRVYDTNPPLVGLVGLVFSDYRRYACFSCRSTQDRKRGPCQLPLVTGPRCVCVLLFPRAAICYLLSMLLRGYYVANGRLFAIWYPGLRSCAFLRVPVHSPPS